MTKQQQPERDQQEGRPGATNAMGLTIMLKAPRLGLAKTRLAATVGNDKALEIYGELLDRLTGQLRELGPVELRFAPDDAGAEVERWLRPGWRTAPQGNGPLGERLERAFRERLGPACGRLAVIGADCPRVTAEDIREAWAALETHDAVLGPALDGGYWLIGLKDPCPALFQEIAWSTERVLEQTLRKAEQAGLRVRLLRKLGDIDTQRDWMDYLASPE